ncbi:MAG TPA: hypothetical protein VF643_09010 [Sphingomonas sp.]
MTLSDVVSLMQVRQVDASEINCTRIGGPVVPLRRLRNNRVDLGWPIVPAGNLAARRVVVWVERLYWEVTITVFSMTLSGDA